MNFPIIENSYNFRCTQCGNCCSGEQQVNLNPYDLYKMAFYKGYDHTRLLFEKKLVHLVLSQNNAWIPQIRFKSISKKKHRFCPFLINEFSQDDILLGLCSLHPDKKPLICSMSPVGRIIDFKNNSEKFIYVKPAPDCPGVDINKENRLSDLQETFKTEFDYEKQFLRILDQLCRQNLSREYYMQHLYSFSVSETFAGPQLKQNF